MWDDHLSYFINVWYRWQSIDWYYRSHPHDGTHIAWYHLLYDNKQRDDDNDDEEKNMKSSKKGEKWEKETTSLTDKSIFVTQVKRREEKKFLKKHPIWIKWTKPVGKRKRGKKVFPHHWTTDGRSEIKSKK